MTTGDNSPNNGNFFCDSVNQVKRIDKSYQLRCQTFDP